MTVLDASAVAALLFEESGGGRVADIVATGEAAISAVNFSEVGSLLMRREVDDVVGILSDLENQVEVIPFDGAHAREAALLTPLASSHGLGIGDRACLSLGHMKHHPVVTADRVWLAIADAIGVEVELLRSSA